MWRASPLMPGSFWDRWKSRMWILSRGFRPPSPSIRKPPPKIPVPLWAPSRRFTTICVCLYARIGIPHCPGLRHGRFSSRRSTRLWTRCCPCRRERAFSCWRRWYAGRKGEHVKEFEAARKSGYVRVRVDGNIYDLSEDIKLEKNKKHTIEIVVDRLVISADIKGRLADSHRNGHCTCPAGW